MSGGPRTEDLRKLATTWVGGRSVDWSGADRGARAPRRVSLPAYPFERVRCWVTPEEGAPSVIAPLALRDKLHPFLGRNESDADGLRYVLDVHLDDLLDYGCTSGERQDKKRGVIPTFAVDLAIAATKVSGFADGSAVRPAPPPGPGRVDDRHPPGDGLRRPRREARLRIRLRAGRGGEPDARGGVRRADG